MNTKDFSIEEAFEKLNTIIHQMEGENLSLAESMNLYKSGVELLNQCRETLDTTQKELIILRQGKPDAEDRKEADAEGGSLS